MWRNISALRTNKPTAVITITNDISQESIFEVVDKTNERYGATNHIDGFCGFGALLNRDYLGSNSLVNVLFAWDQKPKRTIISFYSTNALTAAAWGRDMTNALQEHGLVRRASIAK